MNWLTNFRTPGLKGLLGNKKDTPDNLWVKCPTSGELVYRSDLEESWYVTPAGAHLRISPRRRFRMFKDMSLLRLAGFVLAGVLALQLAVLLQHGTIGSPRAYPLPFIVGLAAGLLGGAIQHLLVTERNRAKAEAAKKD